MLGIIDITLVQDVLLQLADFIGMFLQYCEVGLLFCFVVHPDQCLCVLQLTDLLFQAVSSCLHCADLYFRVFLPPLIAAFMFDEAVYVGGLGPQVEYNV